MAEGKAETVEIVESVESVESVEIVVLVVLVGWQQRRNKQRLLASSQTGLAVDRRSEGT